MHTANEEPSATLEPACAGVCCDEAWEALELGIGEEVFRFGLGCAALADCIMEEGLGQSDSMCDSDDRLGHGCGLVGGLGGHS